VSDTQVQKTAFCRRFFGDIVTIVNTKILRITRYILLAALFATFLLTMQCSSSFESTPPRLPDYFSSPPQTETSNFIKFLGATHLTKQVIQYAWLPIYFLLLVVEVLYIQKLNKPRVKSIPFIVIVTILTLILWGFRSVLVCTFSL